MMDSIIRRHHFHEEQSTRKNFRDLLVNAPHKETLEKWLKWIAEAYVEDGSVKAGSLYAAALSEIGMHAGAELHEQLASNESTKQVVKHCVIQRGRLHHLDVLRSLLAAGVSANLKLDEYEFTPLHWVATNGVPIMAKVLLEHGADLEASGAAKMTPLMRAVALNDSDMALWLLKRKADAEAKSGSGKDVLLMAITSGQERKVLEAIVEGGADVVEVRGNGESPILCAARYNHPEAITYLVSLGVPPDSQDLARYYSPLYIALNEGHGESVRALLACGADPAELRGKDLAQYLMPEDVEYVRSFLLEYGIIHAMDIPNAKESVHNETDVGIFARKSSASRISPL